MKRVFSFLVLVLLFGTMKMGAVQQKSVYTQKPDDPGAMFFTSENFPGITADGKTDVSLALQAAINRVKTEQAFGILFIPEGRYRISRTIYIPGAVRVIGYGQNRPEFILSKNSWFRGRASRRQRQEQIHVLVYQRNCLGRKPCG